MVAGLRDISFGLQKRGERWSVKGSNAVVVTPTMRFLVGLHALLGEVDKAIL